jgi:uncharacterized membrane protein
MSSQKIVDVKIQSLIAGGFILHILHSLFDKILYSVYVHSKNNKPILYGSI